MKEQLITLKTAKLAKEKGFDYKTISYYSHPTEYEPELTLYNINDEEELDFCNWNKMDNFPWLYYSAPTQSLLQEWLRETYNMHINISNIALINSVKNDGSYNYSIFKPSDKTNDKGLNYKEMLESALQKALELI